MQWQTYSTEIGDSLRKQYGMDIVNLMPTNLYGPNDNFTKYSHGHLGLYQECTKQK